MFVIFLDFHSTQQGLPLDDSWSHGLDKLTVIPRPEWAIDSGPIRARGITSLSKISRAS